MSEIDLQTEQAEMRRALADAIAGVKDDMTVLTAIVLRLEAGYPWQS
jgi:hypothetical protein